MRIKWIAGAGAVALGAAALAAAPEPAPAGNAAKGKALFARCAACHAVVPGKNGIGPSLAGVVGRRSASVPGYAYSPAMQASKLKWDEATLGRFLAGPRQLVPGTRMIAAPIAAPQDRADLTAYLKTTGSKTK
ncbi:c-type cytochrome [Sphingomonas hengshuiensis]|uniref:Cytochrome C n=1 Tax=Sphingomonas hengshuiensis TaxID=1609977 RepID=A0A7U4LG06_9SPHN|nr:c-type cytochrome [Sphingomonas hengshuiensis]AJP72674.1 cytochrome C [Sphingomonas hengshuiensis]